MYDVAATRHVRTASAASHACCSMRGVASWRPLADRLRKQRAHPMPAQEDDRSDRNRMPFQVLIIPYRNTTPLQYAAFFREDSNYWQFIAGGSSKGEDNIQAAHREAEEEAGIPQGVTFLELQTVTSVPTRCFRARIYWPQDLYVIPEYCFAVNTNGLTIMLSHEHTRVEWLSFEECHERLYWQSNQVARWELNERLKCRLDR